MMPQTSLSAMMARSSCAPVLNVAASGWLLLASAPVDTALSAGDAACVTGCAVLPYIPWATSLMPNSDNLHFSIADVRSGHDNKSTHSQITRVSQLARYRGHPSAELSCR